ncbi:PIR protein [Plasmodium yoelii]|uniref:PIR protein n=2 Tax=Plasmodium yoelii TaxID=5861 RepID=A0AAF0B5N6_PLAYO|nr:PIR protein [Plasmodium yoelii]WBY60523.1 PIR protein [Plasmodium yoelii yoelii]CDS44832.1 YIR protein [Plasmodium yoelii]VTZ81300.1 PIR protein [Plasmodium yoelii]|eukprot:XP_022811089.2 PIR protein [Plasmodium yoelii]
MNDDVCKTLQDVKEWFLDKLGSNGHYQLIKVEDLEKYCIDGCDTNFDKINAGCLYLLDQFYKDSGIAPSPSKSNPNVVDNIFIWLSYMLNLNKTNKHDNMQYFYDNYIKQRSTYKVYINELSGYENYKDLIDTRKYLLNMDSNIVSKFYEALNLLCNLYNELDYNNKNCENYLDNSEFLKKYQELEQDTSITGNKSYKEILSTLSTDYDGFKRECNSILSSLSAETKDNPGLTPGLISGQDSGLYLGLDYGQESEPNSESSSEATSSSSSITSKLIPVLLILGAIPIFLGIAYKYSLFGFRKRVQKHLREKLKK